MASLPPTQPQRSSSAQHDSSANPDANDSQNTESQNDTTQSTATLDSQTVLVSAPTSSTASSQPQSQSEPEEAQQVKEQTGSEAPKQQTGSESEPRRCWICFSDETEDTPLSSEWKSPCPCALVAHEACLLDWVASKEAPQNGRQNSIQCPQCKTDIQISRPRSLLVALVAASTRVASKMTIPGIFIALGGSVLSGALFHGLASVRIVFGEKDFTRLINPIAERSLSGKWLVGAPLIPVALVASRTTMADGVLPFLPIIFFASHVPEFRTSELPLWPPSAAMTFSMLPYVRAVYNQLFRQLFSAREKRWIQELQPRMTENAEQENDHDHDHHHHHDEEEEEIGGIALDLEIIHEEIPDDAPPHQRQQVLHADEVHQIWDQALVRADEEGRPIPQGQADNPLAQNEAQNQNPPQGQAQPPNPARRNNDNAIGGNWIVNTSRAADAFFGALCFPVVAAVAGEVIRKVLPPSLTTASAGTALRRPTLLQTKWGRSVVGGCLFVVVKDTLVLYSKYRLAQNQRSRRIVDWSSRQAAAARAAAAMAGGEWGVGRGGA